LALGKAHGIIGAGANQTAIIAKNGGIDMIIADGKGASGVGCQLSDITLQGGLNGIHHVNTTAGTASQFTNMFLSHVTFRDMSNAGILFENIFGWVFCS
jgi:hypothetical protein